MKSREVLKIVLALSIGVVALALAIGFTFPRDITREGITFEEAQSLVIFPICMPSYLGQDTDPAPTIVYAADAADVPEETYVQLRYFDQVDRQLAFEVEQRHTPHEGLPAAPADAERARESAALIMILWMSPEMLSRAEMEQALERTQVEAEVIEEGGLVIWHDEIMEPVDYRSRMFHWISGNVEYRVLSHLPRGETEQVVFSMLKCQQE